MPRKRTRKFIDKKNATTFYLAQRSWRDPLHASEEGSQHLLMPFEESDRRKKEQRNYGVYFDDDYDYLQHLKKSSHHLPTDENESKLILPASSLFGVEFENHNSFISNTYAKGPHLDWDPDIVAAIDDDFDFENSENELEDDFIAKAKQDSCFDNIVDTTDDTNLEKSDISDEDRIYLSEETRSKFSNYSVSSSIIRRNSGLKIIDGKFEKIFENYNNENIGALDQEEIHGHLKPDSKLLSFLIEDIYSSGDLLLLKKKIPENDPNKVSDQDDENLCESESSDNLVNIYLDDHKEKFDCESILTINSTTVNQPLKIVEQSLKRKQVLYKLSPPLNTSKVGINSKLINFKNANESTEEKKLRKQSIKQNKRERRMEKKSNKKAFKSEKIKQEKAEYFMRQNFQGIKLD